MAKEIKIKYLNNETEKINKIKVGDWLDLRTAEDIILSQNEYKLIRLGVCMELPNGYEAHVLPRSSTFKNFGIIMANSMGIIDNSYCGDNDEWRFPAYATRRVVIPKGSRIAQFRIIKRMESIDFIEVETLGNSNRGGFGSTGVK